ncbi:MAG: hypothetical protein QOF76_658 [Solirubrobacteraceae bacterium]|jgi:hypothetical protein|nr:hypothetical protein [Solirubrobacteraceae bacterium]
MARNSTYIGAPPEAVWEQLITPLRASRPGTPLEMIEDPAGKLRLLRERRYE